MPTVVPANSVDARRGRPRPAISAIAGMAHLPDTVGPPRSPRQTTEDPTACATERPAPGGTLGVLDYARAAHERTGTMTTTSLYSNAMPTAGRDPEPRPDPRTEATAAVETVDNDRAELMLDAGVVR